MSNGTEHRKLAAIIFTDMVGCSALAEEESAVAAMRGTDAAPSLDIVTLAQIVVRV